MASDAMKGKLQRLKAAQLLAIAAAFKVEAKNGTEAFSALSQLEDADLQEAIDVLNDPQAAAAAPVSTSDESGKLDPAKDYKIRLRKGTDRELHYNGQKYIASVEPKRCTAMPSHVADHYLQWFAENDLPIYPVIAVAQAKKNG